MAYEVKMNTGSLFINERKQQDNHPDRTGSACIECPWCKGKIDQWISGWKKEKDGKQWLSLAFKPKQPDAGENV